MKHVKPTDDNPAYISTNFEICGYTTNSYSSSLQGILSRPLALIANALQERIYLPKVFVFVFDNDIINASTFTKEEFSLGFDKILTSLLTAVHRLIKTYKEKLPTKAKRDFFPHIWISPPDHISFPDRIVWAKFVESLEKVVAPFDEMCTLKLKKIWDPEDPTLYIPERCSYSQIGLLRYWSSVDAAVKFWDRTLNEILLKKTKEKQLPFNCLHTNSYCHF